MKLFETFKIKEEHLEAIKTLSDLIDADRMLLGEVASRLKTDRDSLFGGIKEVYPELADYEFSYNHITQKVSINGLKKGFEK